MFALAVPQQAQLPPPALVQKHKEYFDKWMFGGFVRDDELDVAPDVGICVGADVTLPADAASVPSTATFVHLRDKYARAVLGPDQGLVNGRHGLLRFMTLRLTRRTGATVADVAADVEQCFVGGLVNEKVINPIDEWVRDGMLAEWLSWASAHGDDTDKRDLMGASRALKTPWADFVAGFHASPLPDAGVCAALERVSVRRRDVDAEHVNPAVQARFSGIVDASREGLQAQARVLNPCVADAALGELTVALGPAAAAKYVVTSPDGHGVGMAVDAPFRLKTFKAFMVYLVRLARVVVLANLRTPVYMHVTKADVAHAALTDSVDALVDVVARGDERQWDLLNRFQQLHAAVAHICLRCDMHSADTGRLLSDVIDSAKPMYPSYGRRAGFDSGSDSEDDADETDPLLRGMTIPLPRLHAITRARTDVRDVLAHAVFGAPVEFGETWPQRTNAVQGEDITPFFQLVDCVATPVVSQSPRIHKEKYDDKSIAPAYRLHYTAQTDDKFESVVCTGTPSVPMLLAFLDADTGDAHVFAALLDDRRSRMWQFDLTAWIAAMGGSNPLPDAVMDKSGFTSSVHAAVWWLLMSKMLGDAQLFACASRLCELVVCHAPEVQTLVLWALFVRLAESQSTSGFDTAPHVGDAVKEAVLRTLHQTRNLRPATELCVLQRLELVARLKARSLVSLSNLSVFHSRAQFRDVGVVVRKRTAIKPM